MISPVSMTLPLARSYLATPAHRLRMVQSAAGSAADALFLDLEDAVPVDEKAEALSTALKALSEIDFGTKHVAVRVNASTSQSQHHEILSLCAAPRLNAIIVPKAETCDDIQRIASLIQQASPPRARPLAIELLIETARGLMNVDQLAGLPCVSGLHLGVGDLAASLGARSGEIGSSPTGYRHVSNEAQGSVATPLDLFAYPMMRILVAARAFGLFVIDGPCGAFKDGAISQASAIKAAAMGFDGKQVIHPSQIEMTNEAFTPSTAEVEAARRILEALEQAQAQGMGAVTVDGKMIDLANERMVRRTLALADRLP